jgi:hypothetical protein
LGNVHRPCVTTDEKVNFAQERGEFVEVRLTGEVGNRGLTSDGRQNLICQVPVCWSSGDEKLCAALFR